MSVTIKYKGNTIASANTDTTKTLKTSGKYCEGDIVVENVQDGGITPSGSITLTEERSYDVTDKAQAIVDFSSTRANLAEAVTAKGVDTLPTSSFDTIATNIGLISGGGGLNVTYVTTIPVTWTNSNLTNLGTFSLDGYDYDCIIFNGDKGNVQSVYYTTKASATIKNLYSRSDAAPLPNTLAGFSINLPATKESDSALYTYGFSRMGSTSAQYFPTEVKVYVAKIGESLFPFN